MFTNIMESEIETLYKQLSLKQRRHIKEYMKQAIIRENEMKKFSNPINILYDE